MDSEFGIYKLTMGDKKNIYVTDRPCPPHAEARQWKKHGSV